MNTEKKYGILTLSASDNCGSLLQTYALKKCVEKYCGVECEVIPFASRSSHLKYDIFPKQRLGLKKIVGRLLYHKELKNLMQRLLNYKKLKEQKEGYEVFRSQYIGMDSGQEILDEQISKYSDAYDVLIVGSDQVWNVRMQDFSPAFLGGWSNGKKIAYAPSLGGTEIDATGKQEYVKALQQFHMLSVREKKGQASLERVLGKPVELLADPTLVLPQEHWKELVGEPLVKGDYIFYYSWAYRYEELLSIVRKEAERLQMPVYVVDYSKWLGRGGLGRDFHMSPKEGPLAFLNLMYYAKRAFVESFHGMIFAAIFQKDFWLLDTYQEYESMDTRLKELTGLLKVKNRILTKYNYEQIDKDMSILYDENRELSELVNKSIEFLKRIKD